MKETGNALFLILIAVALFAALSYAVTQSGRGGASVNREEASLTASQILQFAANVNNGIDRVRLLNGCSVEQLSFLSSDMSGFLQPWHTNPSSPGGNLCDIFHENGGGVDYVAPFHGHATYTTDPSNTTVAPYYTIVSRGQIHGVGETLGTELLLTVPRINEELCRAFNALVLGDSQIYDARVGGFTSAYQGTFTHDGANDSYAAIGNASSPEMFGQFNGCLRSPDDATLFTIYSVLIAR